MIRERIEELRRQLEYHNFRYYVENAYMVKIDVKIDDNAQEDDDKDYYDDEIKGADEIQDDGNSDGGDDSDDDVNI